MVDAGDSLSHAIIQGLKFDVVVSNFDEDLDKARFTGGAGEASCGCLAKKARDTFCQNSSLTPFFPQTDYAKATATQKAIEVATRLEKDERVPFMIIGADTVVEAPDGSIMEKPKVWNLTVCAWVCVRDRHRVHVRR